MQKIKAALTRSATVAWLALASAVGLISQAAGPLLQLVAMPEAATLIDAYKPGWSTIVIAVLGILARLRTLDLRG
ncbi:MAG: hypothetical protein ACJ8FU_25380 [Xanthobacteraceae bacterium]